jgi:hypothetical protein
VAVKEVVIDHTLRSDFVYWAATRLFRGTMVESILGAPLGDVTSASRADQQRTYAMLDLVQPISLREKGLRNEGMVGQSLRRYELEKIAAPTLIAAWKTIGT